MARLSGKSALVTGGRQGIGRAIVDAYILTEGASVFTCGQGVRGRPDFDEAIAWHQTDVSERSRR